MGRGGASAERPTLAPRSPAGGPARGHASRGRWCLRTTTAAAFPLCLPFPSPARTPPPARCCCVSALGWRLLELAALTCAAPRFAPVPAPRRSRLAASEPRRAAALCRAEPGTPRPARGEGLGGRRREEKPEATRREQTPGPRARSLGQSFFHVEALSMDVSPRAS